MRGLMSRAAACARRLWRAERFRPDTARDIFLVTYPRSGTTWISCLAAELLFGISPKSLAEIDSIVPDVYKLPRKSLVPAASQYLVKSHYLLSDVLPFGEYRRVIYLVRDPRDVLLSYYRYRRGVSGYSGSLKDFATDWVCGRIWPSSWQEHINSWLGPRTRPARFELTVLRYEDFAAGPVHQIGILAGALGVPAGLARIEEIAADTTPEAMRRRETFGKNDGSPEFEFIGPAAAGNWKKVRSREDLEAIAIVEQFTQGALELAGYARRGGQGSALSGDFMASPTVLL